MRKHIKKSVSIMLALMMIMGVMTIAPLTANAETSGDWTYIVNEYDQAGISGYTGSGGDVTVPSELGGYPVMAIMQSAFADNEDITSVTLPDSVMVVQSSAFANCTNLTSVTFLAMGTQFTDGTEFSGCSSLTTFYGYSGSYTEWYVSNGYYPVTFSEITADTFTSGDWTYIVQYGQAGIVSYSGSDSQITLPTELDGYTVGAVMSNAFAGNTTLTDVTLPAAVYVYSSAFENCTNLESVRVLSTDTYFYDETVFSGCSNLTIYGYSGSSAESYAESYNIPFVVLAEYEYTVENGEATITAYLGSDADITVPSELGGYTVTTIGAEAFKDNTTITSVYMYNNITSIGNQAFAGCINLGSVTLGNGVTSIGSSAFSGCTSLTRIHIPKKVTNIGTNAFAGCPNLTILGYINSAADIYAGSSIPFVPYFLTNTGNGYSSYSPLTSTQTKDAGDASFSLSQSEFKNIELLGVQKKTDSGTNDMRFVAVVNRGIIKSALEAGGDVEDYGFVIARTNYTSTAGATENYIKKVTLNAAGTVTRSCMHTDNTYSGLYGSYKSDTMYKYVTLAVKDVPDDMGFVVRFYVKTSSGRVYYADYKSGYTGCVTSYSYLSSLVA